MPCLVPETCDSCCDRAAFLNRELIIAEKRYFHDKERLQSEVSHYKGCYATYLVEQIEVLSGQLLRTKDKLRTLGFTYENGTLTNLKAFEDLEKGGSR